MKPLRKDNQITFSDNRTKVMLVASFLMPIFILLAIAWRFKIYPFSGDCFMTRPMQDQYLPVIAELRRKILHGESLFYTWNAGGGSDFWTRIVSCAASPFNLLYLCFAHDKLAQATEVIFALKTAVASLSFACMLWKKDRVVSPLCVGLSVAYALSGFVLTYSQEPWMLDVVILLPLLCLSLSKLIQGTHRWMFAVVCALLSMNGFRISPYLLLFILVIFPLLYIEQRHREEGVRHFGSVIKDFLIYFFLGLAMAAAFWWPALLSRWHAAIDDTLSFPSDYMAMDLKVWDILERAGFDAPVLFPTDESQLPSVYCGIFTVILSILYGFSEKISITEKIYSYCMLVTVYISMSSRLLRFVFQGLHFPIIGYYPQAIIIVFMLVYMAGRLISTGSLFSDKSHLYGAMAMILAFLLIHCKISYDYRYENYAIYMAIAFIAIYVAFSATAARSDGRLRVGMAAGLMVTMLLEAGIGFYRPIKEKYFRKTVLATSSEAPSRENISDVLDHVGDIAPVLANEPKKVYKLADTVLFRVRDEQHVQIMNEIREKLPMGGRVEVSLAGWENNGLYEGVGTLDNLFYLSSSDYAQTLRVLGINNGDKGEIDIKGSTPITNSFFNVPLHVTSEYGQLSLVETKTGGSNGYFTTAKDINEDIFTSQSAFVNQNELAQRFTGIMPFQTVEMELHTKKNVEEKDGSLYAENSKVYMEANLRSKESINTPIYIYCNSEVNASIEIQRVDEGGFQSFVKRVTLPQNSWIEVSPDELKGEKLGLQLIASEPGDTPITVTVAKLDANEVVSFEQAMEEAAWTITNQKDGLIQGTIDAPTSGSLVLSVPYDTGWKATIDGEETDILAGFQSFLTVQVTEGHHEVKFVYRTQGVDFGTYCTIGATGLLLLLSVSVAWTEKKRMKKTMHTVHEGECMDKGIEEEKEI